MFMLEEFCSGVLMSKSDKMRLSHHCCLAFNADSALGISAKRLDLHTSFSCNLPTWQSTNGLMYII